MIDRHCTVDGCPRPPVCRGWCRTHYARWLRRGGDPAVDVTNQGLPEEVRFWMKVDADGDCWQWTGARIGSSRGHYGGFHTTRTGERRVVVAHRYAYELLVGPVPRELQLDHLCRNRLCVNTDHLQVVTPRENTLRGNTFQRRNALKTHCVHGHPFDDANTLRYVTRRGVLTRECRTCHRERTRRRKTAARALA